MTDPLRLTEIANAFKELREPMRKAMGDVRAVFPVPPPDLNPADLDDDVYHGWVYNAYHRKVIAWTSTRRENCHGHRKSRSVGGWITGHVEMFGTSQGALAALLAEIDREYGERCVLTMIHQAAHDEYRPQAFESSDEKRREDAAKAVAAYEKMIASVKSW